jgi:hypothetical protein
MTEENEDLLPSEESPNIPVATEEEEREIEIDESEVGGGTLSDKLALAPNLSDMQSAMVALLPEGFWSRMFRLYKLVVVGRISPDSFIALLRIAVKSIIKRSNPRRPVDVGEIVTAIYAILSKGLDGKGIIDILELAGAAREQSELEKLGGGPV